MLNVGHLIPSHRIGRCETLDTAATLYTSDSDFGHGSNCIDVRQGSPSYFRACALTDGACEGRHTRPPQEKAESHDAATAVARAAEAKVLKMEAEMAELLQVGCQAHFASPSLSVTVSIPGTVGGIRRIGHRPRKGLDC